MRTLIINGSPKKNGDTTALLDELVRYLEGEAKIISCFDNIAPCCDCRYCWKHSGCALQDDMQEIYPYFEDLLRRKIFPWGKEKSGQKWCADSCRRRKGNGRDAEAECTDDHENHVGTQTDNRDNLFDGDRQNPGSRGSGSPATGEGSG